MKYLILIHQNRNARAQFASFPAEVQAAGLAAGLTHSLPERRHLLERAARCRDVSA
jgi:hypothetical protein